MSPRKTPSAEIASKIALLGATTLEGVRVREALEQARVPGALVDLYDHSDGDVLLGEYAGEARLIQNPDGDEIDGHRVILLCGASPAVEQLVERAADALVIDLVGALPERAGARLLRPDDSAAAASRGFYRVPHPVALVLADLLRPIAAGPGVEEALAVVLRPAVDYGKQGVEELREQTVRLLNFMDLPVATFGRQLAFNLVPEQGLACAQQGQEQAIARQVAGLLGWDDERLALRMLAAPLFYGHGVELRVRSAAGINAVREALRAAGLPPAERGPRIVTPLEVADERTTRLGELSADGLGGYWLWAVAGRAGTRAAELAVELARRVIGD